MYSKRMNLVFQSLQTYIDFVPQGSSRLTALRFACSCSLAQGDLPIPRTVRLPDCQDLSLPKYDLAEVLYQEYLGNGAPHEQITPVQKIQGSQVPAFVEESPPVPHVRRRR